MIARIFKQIIDNGEKRRIEDQRNLIRAEAKIGGQLFGQIPAGHRREFFCLDEHTWVWHEQWTDTKGSQQILTTRYDVRPDGVLKSQNGQYSKLSQHETEKLIKAAQLYAKNVKTNLYGLPA